MNTRAELLVYTLLIALAAFLSFFLVRNVLTARAERAGYNQGGIYTVPTETVELPEPTPLLTAINVFRQRQLFENLNELLPTATKVVSPTPTPTVEPLCNGWSIPNIIGKVAQIREPNGKSHFVKAGDTIPKNDPAASHKVLAIEKGRVFIVRSDGVMGWFMKQGGVEYTTEPPK